MCAVCASRPRRDCSILNETAGEPEAANSSLDGNRCFSQDATSAGQRTIQLVLRLARRLQPSPPGLAGRRSSHSGRLVRFWASIKCPWADASPAAPSELHLRRGMRRIDILSDARPVTQRQSVGYAVSGRRQRLLLTALGNSTINSLMDAGLRPSWPAGDTSCADSLAHHALSLPAGAVPRIAAPNCCRRRSCAGPRDTGWGAQWLHDTPTRKRACQLRGPATGNGSRRSAAQP